MMSMCRWTALWLLFIGYLFLGAFLFYWIERGYEEYRRLDENPEKLDIEGEIFESIVIENTCEKLCRCYRNLNTSKKGGHEGNSVKATHSAFKTDEIEPCRCKYSCSGLVLVMEFRIG